jgi:lysozyme
MDREKAKALLAKHEGLRTKPYRDSLGILTIGFGRNLEDVGVRVSEAHLMLENDIDDVDLQLRRLIPCYQFLTNARQAVLVDMGFMGVTKLLQFKKMLGALERGDYQLAAIEILNSKWATQVGTRATELAAIMRAG